MLEQERETALKIVQLASQISQAVQGEIAPGRWDKEDRTPVTVADLAVQAVVSGMLQERYPQDILMAEEGAEELRQPGWSDLLEKVVHQVHSVRPEAPPVAKILDWIERGQQPIDPARRYWVLDPVDGTKGFLRKEQYAVALALIERGQILLGVLGCPNLPEAILASSAEAGSTSGRSRGSGQIYVAVRGCGAECIGLEAGSYAGSPVRVSTDEDPAAAYWCERVEASAGNKDKTAQIVERLGIVHPPYRLDSQAKYAVVARGEASLYLRHTLDPSYREKVWDHAAGVLIVEEAGGKTTDLYGRPLDFSRGRQLSGNRGIVSSSGRWHDRVVAAAKSVLNLPDTAESSN